MANQMDPKHNYLNTEVCLFFINCQWCSVVQTCLMVRLPRLWVWGCWGFTGQVCASSQLPVATAKWLSSTIPWPDVFCCLLSLCLSLKSVGLPGSCWSDMLGWQTAPVIWHLHPASSLSLWGWLRKPWNLRQGSNNLPPVYVCLCIKE